MSNNVFEARPLTAYGDIRTATLTPEIQLNFNYTVNNTRLTTNTVTNSGTVSHSDAMAVIGTGTTTNSTALLQSVSTAHYRAGLGGTIRLSCLFSVGVANTYQFIGVMDETGSTAKFKNGIALGFDGTTFGLHVFSNDSMTTYNITSWDDPLGGSGDSGMTLDNTKLNNWIISFQGSINIYIENSSTGEYIKVHSISYSNQNTTPQKYISNYKLTIYTDNDSTTSDIIAKCSNIAYLIEGVNQFFDVHQPIFSSGAQSVASVSTTETAILTIKVKTTYASLTNFIDSVLMSVNASIEASSANNLATVKLIMNTTLGGTPSYSDINTSDSTMSIDTAGTTITGGVELGSFQLAGKNDKVFIELYNKNIFLQAGDTLTISAESVNSADFYASIVWKELF